MKSKTILCHKETPMNDRNCFLCGCAVGVDIDNPIL